MKPFNRRDAVKVAAALAIGVDVTKEVWSEAEKKAKETRGFVSGVKQKNNMLIAAVLEELAEQGKHPAVLTELCDRLLKAAGGVHDAPARAREDVLAAALKTAR